MRGTRFAILLLLVSCANEPESQQVVTEANKLDIVSFTTEQLEDNGSRVFFLRAYDGENNNRATVRITRGEIPDLAASTSGGNNLGSEVVVSIDGVDASRMLTRTIDEITYAPSGSEDLAALFTISSVESALASRGRLTLPQRSVQPATEQALWYAGCQAQYLNTTPTARECCMGDIITINQYYVGLGTGFHRDDQVFVSRTTVAPIEARRCKAADGVSLCSGRNCVFGPNGFRAAQLWYPPGSGYGAYIFPYYNACSGTWYPSSDPSQVIGGYFGDLNGTFPSNMGCCVNGAGPCHPTSSAYGWPICSTCNSPCPPGSQCEGGLNDGAGSWDY